MDKGISFVLISSIYQFKPTGIPERVKDRFSNTLLRRSERNQKCAFFFRADDIGVPSGKFFKMMDLFVDYRIPLCLATVPTWLTRKRWESMKHYHTRYRELFCWSMHGWRHMNHEQTGRKHEFGLSRSQKDLDTELGKGMNALKQVMKDRFSPFFTPPWNRCSMETMKTLQRLGFKGISRNQTAKPPPPPGLREFSIHVDLHTRKEKSFQKGWDQLFAELHQGMDSGICGIMLHHQRMNEQAFMFLDYLLEIVSSSKYIRTMTFDQLNDL